MASSDFIFVARYQTPAHAQAAQGILTAAGIEAMIEPDPSMMATTRYNADGYFPPRVRVQLLVRAADLEKAREALHHHAGLR